MPVSIHGKEYYTVAERLDEFIKHNPEYTLVTEYEFKDTAIICKTTITTPKRTATGIAYEKENSTMINKTSYIENCETSSVGRALSFLGYAGTEICSAEEVATAIKNQSSPAFRDVPIPAKCSGCGETVTEKVKLYSIKEFNKVLCFACQKIVKEDKGDN